MTFRPVTIEDGRVVEHRPEERVQEQGWTAGLSTPQATPMLLTGECVACGENWLKDGMREHPCGDPKVSVPKLMARLATAEAERDRLADDKARIDWFDEDHHRLESVFGACIRNEEGGDLRAIIDAERAPSTGGTPEGSS